MLHTGAYWLLWSLRSLMPKRSTWGPGIASVKVVGIRCGLWWP
jgi:hypothetical protein